jgi:two-component system nitrate/nitrite response regulator NarL
VGRQTLRVLLVGDDLLATAGLAALLATQPGLEVVGQCRPEEWALWLEGEQPDAAVWDLGHVVPAALEALAEMAEGVPVLALLGDGGREGEAALAAGARGLLYRDAPPARLAAALAALVAGLTVLDDGLAERLLRPRPTSEPLPEPLTPRELEVVGLLAEGLSNRQIGERLRISDHTAKFHVNAVLGKLGAQSRTDAAVRAARLGLVVL